MPTKSTRPKPSRAAPKPKIPRAGTRASYTNVLLEEMNDRIRAAFDADAATREHFDRVIAERFEWLAQRLDLVESVIQQNGAEIRQNNADIAGLKEAVEGNSRDIVGLKEETASLKEETASLKEETASLKEETASLKVAVEANTRETARLASIVERHGSRLDDVEERVTVLEQACTP